MQPARLSFKPRSLTPEHLNVAPDLVGAPLAADPRRRAAAMAVDLVMVALLWGVSGFWLLGGLALVVLQLRSQRGGMIGSLMPRVPALAGASSISRCCRPGGAGRR